MPRFGPRKEDISESDTAEIDDEWDERFEARHTPHNSRKIAAQRDDGRHDETGQAGSSDAGWDDDSRPAPAHDPWRRDWAQWTSTDFQVGDILNYPPDEFEGGWSRDAWGGEPSRATLDAVALHVELSPPTGKRRANWPALHQFVYWAQKGFKQSARPTKKAMRALTVMAVVGVLLLTSLGTGLTGLVDYLAIKGLASDAVSSLTHLGDDLGFGKSKAHLTIAQRSNAANADVNRALYDMEQLHDRLAHPDFVLSLAGHIGKIHEMEQSGLLLSQFGIEGIGMLQTMLPTLVSLSNVITTSPISTDDSSQDDTPLLHGDDYQKILSNLQQFKEPLDKLISQVQSTPPQTLLAALNSKQQAEVLPLLQGLPYLKQALPIVQGFLQLPSAETLLGIDHPQVAYLLMTLDNSEIRPAGGFQGQYALIGVTGGHISHIALEDTYHYLEPLKYSGPGGQDFVSYNLPVTPESWFGSTPLGWAMRNSGLSPDFPQSARYALWYLHNEEMCVFDDIHTVAGQNGAYCHCNYGEVDNDGFRTCYLGGDRLPNVDSAGEITSFQPQQVPMAGVIMIQSNIISQLLQITGPLKIGCPYYTTVDATHLQQQIHYYQETYRGKHISQTQCSTQISDSTKRFTGLVTQELLKRVKSMPKGDLLRFINDIVQDLHNKEIQIFFTDPTHPGNIGQDAFANGYHPTLTYPDDPYAEQFLRNYQISSELYQGNDDSLAVNRADIAGWKLETYVTIKLVDQITIRSDHSAVHHFQTIYTLNVPRIRFFPNPPTQPEKTSVVNEVVYEKVFDAGFSNLYTEDWRVYMSPNAQITNSGTSHYVLGPNDIREDVPNRSYAFGQSKLAWFYDPASQSITWTPFSTPPALNWVVPAAVNSQGQYIIHVQPQSGVNTSAEIDITLPNGTTCNEMNGPLPQNRVIAVNVNAGTCG